MESQGYLPYKVIIWRVWIHINDKSHKFRFVHVFHIIISLHKKVLELIFDFVGKKEGVKLSLQYCKSLEEFSREFPFFVISR